MDKLFIQADKLLSDSFKLAWKVYESGYRPNYIIGVWRGGAPIGIAVQEFLDVLGVPSDHIAIRTSHYKAMGDRCNKVEVYGLNYIIKQVESEDSLLIVDDVHDTGISIQKIILDLQTACKKNTPEIKVATPYFKPNKNQTNRQPDFYLHETEKWLVFPHELEGLSIEEIIEFKPELFDLVKKIKPFIS
ncbi:phosphoribosyltransferase family protein [Gammaproteobacteria bacterium]|nr:phosphoribosyltransferase family protein [Gammaproteobacteria bacterium]